MVFLEVESLDDISNGWKKDTEISWLIFSLDLKGKMDKKNVIIHLRVLKIKVKKKIEGNENGYFIGFQSNLFLRNACYDCQSNGEKRFSDFTVADLKAEYDNIYSLLGTQNNSFHRLLEEIQKTLVAIQTNLISLTSRIDKLENKIVEKEGAEHGNDTISNNNE